MKKSLMKYVCTKTGIFFYSIIWVKGIWKTCLYIDRIANNKEEREAA